MKQQYIIDEIVEWLNNQSFIKGKCRCDHVRDERETLGLYLGPKLPHKGRTDQIAQVDILVHDDKKVQIIIEVDPVSTPKKILGVIFSAIIAENYTPSNKTNEESYSLDNALILYVTVIDPKNKSQKTPQIDGINKALTKFIETAPVNVHRAMVIYSNSEEEVIKETKKIITEEFNNNQGQKT